ncbi:MULTISPECIES: SpoIIE family protein phosphatase [unclassified Streptomyces]|uniref:SpoIIE family protein phosphatase n=1 Tax=unclassified Streptomyces TaxID=2593676 RepID=UPI0006FE8723|nr:MULTISPECIES: SpoIIE family protein phosphatase [unclassified Streptomyces]KQX53552.1 histidine kinase [Streptomyces sp. Root1304]KRA90470.1 histidine kinase [Streptomyces sp. Root66D1]
MAGQVFALEALIALLVIAAAVFVTFHQAQSDTERDARVRSLAVAEAFAHAPGIDQALASPDPTAVLQSRAEATRQSTGVDFISVLSPAGVRYTDPVQALIGQKASGDFTRATVDGASFTEHFRGAPNDAVRAVVPVVDPHGRTLGLVTSGIEVESITHAVEGRLPLLVGAAAGALVLAVGGAGLVSRRLRRQTHGLGPTEMTRMKEHHEAVLHAVREGVLIVGADRRLLLANDEARRLLGLSADAERRHVSELGLDPRTVELLVSGRSATDEVHRAGDRLLAVSVRPTVRDGSESGSVMTMRDTTELAALTGRAAVARGRLQLLYEAGVRIGTTLEVVRTAEELAEVAVPRFADFATVELLEPVLRGEEPPGSAAAATEMRRTALSGLRPDQPLQPVGDTVRFDVSDTPMATALGAGHAVVQAELAAAEGWRAQDPEGAAQALAYGMHSLLTVPLLARGVVLGMANFWRADTPEPFGEEDLSFAEELAARAAVAIDNARRFTREHAMAVTLQRSLLPRVLPEQSAVEVAYRYLPAKAGVGGDWFDVIPLPGARVALVVGDVVGHGLHAAATMGRLRTAVHNFSTLDVPPDELLGHLDELTGRIDDRESEDPDGEARRREEGITGATCLYAIYDPASGLCTVASAGHPGPALVSPDGRVEFPDLPPGMPLGLGLGDAPFETAQLRLPEGSKLVLFTDGLLEDRGRDLGTGLELLGSTLAQPDRTPEQTCADVLATLLSPSPRDDIALLVAETRMLDPERIAEWEVARDPAAVSPVRNAAAAKLSEWGLDGLAFTAELILSELITNAVRYGADPVRVRLLHDRTLICEVSDGSSTSPHLRHAATTDEGGRGLYLVAQYAERWGTRYGRRGKTIWAELRVGADGPEPVAMVVPDLDALEDLAW